jgi:hypothetical protein
MAHLDIAIPHGQPMEVAHVRFEAAILEAHSRFGAWIGRVDWSEDRRSATFTGSNYEVRFWYDERDVHARGRIPLAWKLFEGAMRKHVKKVIDRPALKSEE